MLTFGRLKAPSRCWTTLYDIFDNCVHNCYKPSGVHPTLRGVRWERRGVALLILQQSASRPVIDRNFLPKLPGFIRGYTGERRDGKGTSFSAELYCGVSSPLECESRRIGTWLRSRLHRSLCRANLSLASRQSDTLESFNRTSRRSVSGRRGFPPACPGDSAGSVRWNRRRWGRIIVWKKRGPGTTDVGGDTRSSARSLVDPASSHMLVSKIKPCMSQY